MWRRAFAGRPPLDKGPLCVYAKQAMNFAKPDPKNHLILRQVLEQASRHGAAGIAVFDLDSTLFDNTPRQARIVREYGAERGIPELTRCKAEDFRTGWDLQEAMRNCGLPPERVEAIFPDV